MKPNFILVIFISSLIIIFYSDVKAQYYENYIIYDVTRFIVKNSANKNIRDKDAEVLKQNKVNEVWIKNEESKPVGKLLVNNSGYIEDYYTFDSVTEAIVTHWRYGYDANNNLAAASLREGRLRLNYYFSYENNLLASIHIDSAGVESQYDIAYSPAGEIIKTTLLDLTQDTVAGINFYTYDSEGRLAYVSNEARDLILYQVNYSENSFRISIPFLFEDFFKTADGRIEEETYSFTGKKHTSRKRLTDEIIFAAKYSFNEKGLIDNVKVKSSKTVETTKYYEYGYFN